MSIIRIQGINEIENGIVYEVDTESKPLGVGGMGQVFRGKRIDSKGVCMDVAIKFLFDDLPQHVIERARREASIQIHNENLGDYEYSQEEVDTKYYDLERFKDPNVRYYACVVDKNRAGPKPKVVFRLNLAYNEWFELGYLRLKAGKSGE